MITKNERDKMKKILTSYVQEVKEYLQNQGITNKQGNPYSDIYIVSVFNGVRENIDIEKAILTIYERKLRAIDDLNEEKQKLLNKN